MTRCGRPPESSAPRLRRSKTVRTDLRALLDLFPLPGSIGNFTRMDWGALASVAVAVTGVGGVMSERRRREPRGRERIKSDLELLELLPSDSQVAAELRTHIEDSVRQMIRVEDAQRRDPFGIALAIVFILIGVGLIAASVLNGGWYWWLAVPGAVTGTFGIAGLAQDATKRNRDERGRPIAE